MKLSTIFVTSFGSITMLSGTNNIPYNIPIYFHIQSESGKYSMDYC
jgi:hypothetical protein